MRRHLRTVAILGITGGLLAFFLRSADLEQVWLEIRRARVWYLVFAGTMTVLLYAIRAIRWQVLLRPIGGARFGPALRATVIGFAASALLPARPGEVLRPYLLARREGLSATAAFATILVERWFDLVTVLLLLGVFVLAFEPSTGVAGDRVLRAVKIGGAIGAAGAIVALAVAFTMAGRPESLARAALRIERVLPARLATVVARLVQAFTVGLGATRQPRLLLWALVLSMALWLFLAVAVWMTTEAFRLSMPFSGAFLLLALLVVGVSVPTPGAVGGFHAAFQIGITTFYGAPNDRAVAAAIVLHAMSFIPVAVVGAVFMAQDGLSLTRVGEIVSPGRDEPTSAPSGTEGSSL